MIELIPVPNYSALATCDGSWAEIAIGTADLASEAGYPLQHAHFWIARPGETLEQFRHRISADLAAQGTEREQIFILYPAGFWHRNIARLH